MSKWNRIGAAALAAALALSPFANTAGFAATPLASQQQDAPSQAEQETFNRGRALFAKAQYEQAATVFRDFLQGHPDSFIADLMLLWLGRSYIELGKFPEAAEVAERLRAIKDTPFSDIYETELQTARAQSATRPAPAAATLTPRAMPVTQVSKATPTPTPPRATPRPTPTPTEVAAMRTTPAVPELSVRGGGEAERPRTAATRRNYSARRDADSAADARPQAEPDGDSFRPDPDPHDSPAGRDPDARAAPRRDRIRDAAQRGRRPDRRRLQHHGQAGARLAARAPALGACRAARADDPTAARHHQRGQ